MAIKNKEAPRMGMVARTGRELAETPGLITVREASNILRICEAGIYTLAKSGEIPSYKLNRRRLFKLEELNNWLQSKQA